MLLGMLEQAWTPLQKAAITSDLVSASSFSPSTLMFPRAPSYSCNKKGIKEIILREIIVCVRKKYLGSH